MPSFTQNRKTISELETRIAKTLELFYKYGSTDGAHHKQWVIDQAARKLLGDNDDHYREFVSHCRAVGQWDEGIAP